MGTETVGSTPIIHPKKLDLSSENVWEKCIETLRKTSLVSKKIPKQTRIIMLGNEGLGKRTLIHNLKKLTRHWKHEIREKKGIILPLEVLDEENSQEREEDEAMEAWKHIVTPLSYHYMDVYDERVEGMFIHAPIFLHNFIYIYV
jgi:ATPase subunit of ABC transporter with duplicated ATPase domains